MKAKVKETSQIVDVVCQGICVGCDKRTVVWTDGEHIYYQEQLDFTKDTDWEQRRYEISKEAIGAILCNSRWALDYNKGYYKKDVVGNALSYADELIEQLKNT